MWEELGSSISGKNIVIAKMDATANDIPAGVSLDVQGFPTIALVKSGDNEVVMHEGDRTLQGFQAFLKANAVHGQEVTISGDEESVDESREHTEL